MYRLLATAVLSVAFAATCVANDSENIQIVEAMIDAVNDRNLGALDNFVAPDVVRHSAATPEVVVTNLDEFRDFLTADIATIPDSIQEIDIIFGAGEYVAIRARLIGTQTGPMGPFPASGKKMELPFMGILRIDEGKIAEIWVEWDNLNALTQLGHFPPSDKRGDQAIVE